MVINYFALDIGEKRIGIARANSIARLVQPVATLANDASFLIVLNQLMKEYDVSKIIVGLPRSMKGDETEQSRYTRAFVKNHLAPHYDIVLQDETLSSVAAEQRGEWLDHGIDAAAACIILEDYLLEHP
jgi:putative Holliday junction resolvase